GGRLWLGDGCEHGLYVFRDGPAAEGAVAVGTRVAARTGSPYRWLGATHLPCCSPRRYVGAGQRSRYSCKSGSSSSACHNVAYLSCRVNDLEVKGKEVQ